jgi:hypothetical protein
MIKKKKGEKQRLFEQFIEQAVDRNYLRGVVMEPTSCGELLGYILRVEGTVLTHLAIRGVGRRTIAEANAKTTSCWDLQAAGS